MKKKDQSKCDIDSITPMMEERIQEFIQFKGDRILVHRIQATNRKARCKICDKIIGKGEERVYVCDDWVTHRFISCKACYGFLRKLLIERELSPLTDKEFHTRARLLDLLRIQGLEDGEISKIILVSMDKIMDLEKRIMNGDDLSRARVTEEELAARIKRIQTRVVKGLLKQLIYFVKERSFTLNDEIKALCDELVSLILLEKGGL